MGSWRNSVFRRCAQFIGQFALILLLTFLLLELVIRLVWWHRSTVSLLDKKLTLLPLPLLNEQQVEILSRLSQGNYQYVQFDPVLGWSITPNARTEWNGNSYSSNSIGIRSLKDYDLMVPDGVTRIAAFGPSFTHGDEVNDDETWVAQMEQARSDLEIMNWGVGAYGTDQSFLRYKTQGQAYQPDIVLIGFEEHNWTRNVNRFRPFEYRDTGAPLTKPVYIAENNELVLLENPFQNFDEFFHTVLNDPEHFLDLVCTWDRLCEESLYREHALDIFASYRFFRTLAFEIRRDPNQNAESKAKEQINPQETTLRIIQMFGHEARLNGAEPVVVIFPLESTLLNYEQGILPSYHKDLIPILEIMGIQFIDLLDAFVGAKEVGDLPYQEFFASQGGHYNRLGNEVVAQTILDQLCNLGLISNCF
jgi:hypothetical protein